MRYLRAAALEVVPSVEKSTMSETCEAPKESLFCALESESISDVEIRDRIDSFLETLGPRDDVLLLPPDFTRFHSQAGKITRLICEHYKFINRSGDDHPANKPRNENNDDSSSPTIQIMPALGTHAPMTPGQIESMFGIELSRKQPSPFLVHDWRNDVVTIGYAPESMVSDATGGQVNEPWPAQLNKLVWSKRLKPTEQLHKSVVISIGQVVPHEVMGMANFNKNLFVGTGGVEAINLSHFIGAVHGMERMMGRKNNPLRSILNYASQEYLEKELDLWYILTVVAPDPVNQGDVCLRGLYIGKDIECYSRACDLSLKVNFTMLDKPVKRMVTFLDPHEFHSTWLGNKAIYRTRMAMADGGELIIMAPGIERFGEDKRVDELIRKYGYKGTPSVMEAMEKNEELRDNLSAVAHLIHGSSEGRFRVTYCPGHITRKEIEEVGFNYECLEEVEKRYRVDELKDGWNIDDEGDFYFIRNPALGLWAVHDRFDKA